MQAAQSSAADNPTFNFFPSKSPFFPKIFPVKLVVEGAQDLHRLAKFSPSTPTLKQTMNSTPPLSTRHALVRMQQRAIPAQMVTWLLDYGSRQPAPGQAALVFFDKAARRRLTQVIGNVTANHLAPLLNAYLIEGSDGRVVTTGWRTARVLRDPAQRRMPSNKGDRHVQ